MVKKICVLGLGYIGLPTAILISKSGYSVIGVDINKEKIQTLKKGQLNTNEPGLKNIFEEAISSGNLTVQTDIQEADAFIIAVPTPLNKEKKKAELKFLISAIEMIKSVLKEGNLVILESTVPPNTCINIIIPILEQSGLKVGNDFLIAHCPERAIPGNTLYEFINNDRIIGGINKNACNAAKKIYLSFCKGKIYLSDLTTTETTKLMENTYRDVNISLANEFAKISKTLGINTWDAINLANKHPRVNIHKPGPGVGGHCIPIDPLFLTENTDDAKLILTARKINDSMPSYVFSMIHDIVKETENPVISILGVAYKPNVDDFRESPAFELIKLCKKEKWNIKVHDPFVKKFDYILDSLDEVLIDSDCVVILTNHEDYYNLSLENFKKVRNKTIIDTRNCINKMNFTDSGFEIIILGDHR